MAIAEPVILMYHRIDTSTSKGSKLVVAPKSFARQMRFLSRANYKVISLEALVGHLRSNERLPQKSAVITFDDGYRDNYINAYPILKTYNFPATIFLVTDWVGRSGFLSRDEIQKMRENRISFGSHTLTHPKLPTLSKEKCREEILRSKEILEQKLNHEVKFFAYPYGAVNREVRDIVKEAGYEAACAASFKRGFDVSAQDRYAIARIRISPTADNLFVFWLKVSGYYNRLRKLQKLAWRNV